MKKLLGIIVLGLLLNLTQVNYSFSDSLDIYNLKSLNKMVLEGRRYERLRDEIDELKDMLRGQTTHTYKSGATYLGQWKDNKRHGQGTLDFSNELSGDYFGAKYSGEWKYDERHGNGVQIFPNGDIFVGEWKNNERNGNGTIRYKKKGGTYEGEWKNNMKNGSGTYIYAGGVKFVGTYKNGKREGQGKLIYPDGRVSEFESKNGKRITN